MENRRLVHAPRSQRDLEELLKHDARRVLEDLDLLQRPPWPPRKVKRLRGSDLWEIKTGDFRSLFLPLGPKAVILRVVNRRGLERSLGHIDLRSLIEWLRGIPQVRAVP